MFNNIGGRIKSIAKTVCYVEIIGCIIAGIVMTFLESFLAGLAIAFFGSAAGWLSSVTAYGFGQLIENTDQLVEQGMGNVASRKADKQAQKTPTNAAKPVQEKLDKVIQDTEAKLSKAQRNKDLKNLLEKGLITEEEYQKRSK